jgi:hypothetical protein
MAEMWEIKSQVQETQISDTGPGFETVWVVTFRITSGPAVGTIGKVNIPVSQYNAQTVKDTITAAVFHIDAVANL